MDEILADYNEAELELLAGFLQKVTAAGVIAVALSDPGGCCRIGDSIRRSDSMPAHPPHCRGRALRTRDRALSAIVMRERQAQIISTLSVQPEISFTSF